MRLIDADKLKDEFITGNEDGAFYASVIRQIIDEQPTVDPVRHGRWVKPNKWSNFHCSVCGCEEGYKRKYCPECGSRMGH